MAGGGRVLITGANGFVGRGVAEGLSRAGHPLALAVRRPESGRSLEALGPVVPVGEVGPATDWAEALRDVSAVVHLAAHVHVAPERAEAEARLFDEVNHLGALRLYRSAAEAGARLFVFLSSVTVLGSETAPGAPFGDASIPAPVGPYARSKLAAEEALRAAAGPGSPRLVILRPPLICGPGVGGNLGALARLARTPLPLPFGGLQNRRTLLARDNLVSALRRVLEKSFREPVSGAFALGDARPLSTTEIVRALREGVGRPARLLPAPRGLLRLGAAALGREGMHRRLFGDLEVDSSGFRQAFGWSDEVDTVTALRETAAFLVR